MCGLLLHLLLWWHDTLGAAVAAALQGPMHQALYDYEAQDEDEVSFMENDTISNVQPVDDGWVIGVVQRTGERGMIPSNYIEQM